jgi:hypothetical protein
MLFAPLFIIYPSLATAAPALNRVYETHKEVLTVTIHDKTPAPPLSENPLICASGRVSDEVYIISNPSEKCGANNLELCTRWAEKVEGLCGGTCVHAVNSTTGEPVGMYGLSHPRANGGYFTLYNGTHCETDTMYFKYTAQRVGNGPVRYVQSIHEKHMEVSPFISFRYMTTRS